jgi:hypothetical protein
MARKECKFRQRDVARAIRAARSSGATIDSVEVTLDGRIVVHFGSGGDNPKHENSADAALRKLEKIRHGKS